jgi:[protein-PII] uridylyltransferase
VNTPASRPPLTPAAALEAARQELVAQTISGHAGRAALECYSDRIDALLQRLYFDASAASQPVAILAIGGYGRRHLALHSDIDLLVLFDSTIGADDERFLRGLLHPLWDLPLVLGHQVREFGDFARLETDNPEFLLALLDARRVAGDPALHARFLSAFHNPHTHATVLDHLQSLIANRHAKFNDTVYQLEPDIKEAPGALRDLLAVRTIAWLTDPAMLDRGPADRARIDQTEDFLFRIRSLIHLERKRNHNVLSHDLQEKCAQALDYAGATPRQRVERFMSDYFLHARGVSRSLEWMRQNAPRPVGVNVVRSRDGVRFIDLERAAREPHTWLGAFQAALGSETAVADESLALIQQAVHRHPPKAFLPTSAERVAFLDLLKPRAGLYARLSEMHDRGLLGRILPEFNRIHSRVVRDFYHKYTVDEHTLLAIRYLERLATSDAAKPRFRELLSDLDSPEWLVLALLYHDVGKWTDGPHEIESARLARPMFERLALPAEARATVEFVIEHHLAMSSVAFRRDTEDPEVVRRFADLVGVEERLKMMLLLTLADLSAVSPDTLTPWREDLLWRLYVDTYNELTISYGDARIVQDQTETATLLSSRPSDIAEEEIRHFLQGLPRRYLRLFAPRAVYRHVQLSRNIGPDRVHTTLEHKGTAWEMTVVTLDKPFLFSNVCGTLSSFGMDILRGTVMTTPGGLVVDVFQFADAERFLEVNADGPSRIVEALEACVCGRLDIAAQLSGRRRGVLNSSRVRRITPTVHADSTSSPNYTVFEISAANEIGLLHRVSRVISCHGCNVELVLISTQGIRANDVFHLTANGAKLTPEVQDALTLDLQATLESTE